MKIIVLGAGILGVSSAWYLSQDGHEVTVIDRQDGCALETSFANGAQISVSYAEPWANPGAPLKLAKWLLRDDSPLLFRWRADWHQWLWGLQFARECLPARTRFNTIQLTNLGLYSRAALIDLRAKLALEYDQLERGILHVFTSDKELEASRPGLELMREFGCTMNFLDRAQTVALEPALNAFSGQIAGAAHAPEDESGDAFKFTQQLALRCARAGVTFRYDTTIKRLVKNGGDIDGVEIEHAGQTQVLSADAYVVALGCWSAHLLRAVGMSPAIYPAKGYSATVPIKPGQNANTVSITDHQMKIVFSRLGDSVRIAGTAELSGYDLKLNMLRCQALTRRAEELFPGVLDNARAQYWSGLRPATPSNLPYIGKSRLGRLWLNTGHGTLGWTHGAGSGRALADLMSQRKPDVDFAFMGS